MDNTLIKVGVGDRIDQDLLVKTRTVLFEFEETFNINVENVLSQEYSYRLQFLYTHDSVCCVIIKNQLKVDSIVFQFVFNCYELFSVDG
jgi:hypothetical protein